MKLQTEQIQGYLAHGLRFISELDKPYEEFGKNTVHTLNGIEELFGDYCLLSKQLKDAYPVHVCKPILRKLDLTKSIKVDGVEILPLLELAKISIPKIQWELKNYSSLNTTIAKSGDFSFSISMWGDFSLTENDGGSYDVLSVSNQRHLFKWLYANLFDVDNLIDKGLAIDADTLENNPYNN